MRAVVKALATVLVLFAAYVAYWMYQDRRAQSAANEFCNALALGSRPSEAIERAKAAGRRTIEKPDGVAFVFQGPIFNAYICELSVADGKIARKQVSAMED
jgi:Tfp pilus assembly protein FimT